MKGSGIREADSDDRGGPPIIIIFHQEILSWKKVRNRKAPKGGIWKSKRFLKDSDDRGGPLKGAISSYKKIKNIK